MTTAHSIERRKTGCLRLAAACMVHIALSSYVPQTADARPVRVATYNIENGVGTVGSDEYNAVQATLARIDADIVCFQELQTTSFAAWSNMATTLGYPYNAIGWDGGSMAGSLYMGYFSRFPILSTHNVVSPPGAKELSRFPFRAVIEVPEAEHPLIGTPELWTGGEESPAKLPAPACS